MFLDFQRQGEQDAYHKDTSSVPSCFWLIEFPTLQIVTYFFVVNNSIVSKKDQLASIIKCVMAHFDQQLC